MKKITLLVAMLMTITVAMGQIKVTNNGKVGIRVNPTYDLDVFGSVRFSIWGQSWDNILLDGANQWGAPQLYCKTANFAIGTNNYPIAGIVVNQLNVRYIQTLSSDEKLKENIKPIKTTLDRILQVEGKSYNYKRNINVSERSISYFEKIREKETFGFLAQDLEKIFPELVYAPDSVNSYYSINYIGMVPVLVEAIKEQQSQIESLQKMLLECCSSENNPIPKSSAPINNNDEDLKREMQKGKLYENTPNPFSVNTEIKFEIPDNAISAQLMICNLNGVELKSFPLTQKGLGSIIIQGSEFAAGIYLYTLLINNQIIDTKKMILTK